MNYKHLQYFWRVARSGGVVKAAEEMHITPQTVSGQIQLLEEQLGTPLFAKAGRNLELTEAGRLAYGYAEEIFSLGAELEESLRHFPEGGRPVDFRVGVADAVPKAIAYRLLAPAMGLPDAVRINCREWKLESLLSELAVHRIDMVLADAPIPPKIDVRAFNHRLGDSGMSFFAAPALQERFVGPFPACLHGAPLLVPGEDAAVRPRLMRWLKSVGVEPRLVGEFDDGALMKAFGQAGAGAFIGATVLEREVEVQYGVQVIGRCSEVREEFFAISVERRLSHPCVLAITRAARDQLFAPLIAG